MNADPNALPDPNDPPAPPEPPEPPPAAQIDLEQAYDVIAQREGWDPRLTRYEIQEHKRRLQEFEREKREFEQEKERSRAYQVPESAQGDPYMREILAIRREIQEEREASRKEREHQQMVNSLSRELDSVYTGLARQSGLTKEQMEQRAEDFYGVLNELYPEPSMLRQIGTERAARAAFRLLGNMPRQPQPYVNGRGRTASVVIPGAVTQSQAPVQDDGGPQRPGESLEDYVMRRRRWREENNVVPIVKDGVRYSSE